VALRLFKPDDLRIYPVDTDKMPVAFEATTSGWQITAAEKTRTGIQTFWRGGGRSEEGAFCGLPPGGQRERVPSAAMEPTTRTRVRRELPGR